MQIKKKDEDVDDFSRLTIKLPRELDIAFSHACKLKRVYKSNKIILMIKEFLGVENKDELR